MKITVDIPNLEGHIKEMERRGEAAVRGVAEAVMTSAVNVQRGAKDECPVKTGRLRSSIGLDIERGGLEVSVGTNVNYAPHVELGTKFMEARPFLFPAAEAERRPHQKRVARAIVEGYR